MPQLNPSEATKKTKTDDCHSDEAGTFRGRDLQDRFGLLLLAYNEAHSDILDAPGPSSVWSNAEAGVFDIEIVGSSTTSTLTAYVAGKDEEARLEPLNFRTTFHMPFFPDFSYEWDQPDAYVIRLMTCWLEKSFLSHQAAILEQMGTSSMAAPARPTYVPSRAE